MSAPPAAAAAAAAPASSLSSRKRKVIVAVDIEAELAALAQAYEDTVNVYDAFKAPQLKRRAVYQAAIKACRSHHERSLLGDYRPDDQATLLRNSELMDAVAEAGIAKYDCMRRKMARRFADNRKAHRQSVTASIEHAHKIQHALRVD